MFYSRWGTAVSPLLTLAEQWSPLEVSTWGVIPGAQSFSAVMPWEVKEMGLTAAVKSILMGFPSPVEGAARSRVQGADSCGTAPLAQPGGGQVELCWCVTDRLEDG
uniref:Uncharacterized protein n=1 Tax=Knipowitschia caucasica TaxID=637954 RepID=A0AAV2LV70_KNICA